MQYCQDVFHVVQPGDSFYRLAQLYHTTVPAIAARNPGINPYNLSVGTRLTICAGENHSSVQDGLQLSNDMRKVWTQHVYWTRMLLISIAEELKDEKMVEAVLLENPADIAAIFARFYSKKVTNQLEQLITEHLEIGEEIIKTLKAGDSAKSETLMRQWYANADSIANLLASVNAAYDLEELRKMLYSHLGMTAREVQARLQGEYQEDIQVFHEVEDGVLTMADYLTEGLIQQFY